MDLIKIRHYLHQHPEVSGAEGQTAKYIVKQLKSLGLNRIKQDFFEKAVLGEIDSGQPGKTLLFRCELDALPIEEVNDDLAYKSVNEGVGHKCGHDGHMTILLGLAEKLINHPMKKGRVLLLFQPAEENGRGAKGVLSSGILAAYDVDFVFALHNVPGYPLGSVVCKKGSFTPSVESLDVVLKGKTSHAGMPEKGVNPATTIAALIQYYQSLHQPDADAPEYFLSTPIQIEMGAPAYGTSAGDGLLSYTFRAYDNDFFTSTKKAIAEKTRTMAGETAGLQARLDFKEGFEANNNEEKAYELIKKAADQLHLKFIKKEYPFSWGEDFGAFTQEFPGAMFGLGSGENQPELHNPDFDFPDAVLDQGIALFFTLTKMLQS